MNIEEKKRKRENKKERQGGCSRPDFCINFSLSSYSIGKSQNLVYNQRSVKRKWLMVVFCQKVYRIDFNDKIFVKGQLC